MIRFVFVLALLLMGVPAYSSFAIFQTGNAINTIQTLKVGAGGQITNVDIQCDQGVGACNNSGTTTKVIRTDTYGAYEWCNNQWVQLVTANSLPVGDPNNVVGACVVGNICGVYEIQIAPSNTNVAYMYFNGYVYKTTNLRACASVTWTATAFPNTAADPNDGTTKFEGPFLAIDPANPNIVMVGTPGGSAYYSTNGGASWTAVTGICAGGPTLNGSAQKGGYVFAFDRSSAVTGGATQGVYLGCYGTGIYRSTTGVSGTFTLTTSTPTTFFHMLCDSAGTLYLALNTDNLIRWYNGTWNSKSVSPSNGNLMAVAVDPANNNNVLAINNAGNTSYTTTGPNGTWSTYAATPTISGSSDIPWFINANDSYYSAANIIFDSAGSSAVYFAAGIGVWTFTASASTGSQTYTGKSIGIEQLVATWVISPPGGKPILTAWDRPVWTVTNPNALMSNYGINHAVQVTEGFGADWCSQNPGTVVALVNAGNSPGGTAGKSTTGGGTGTPSDWTVFGSQPTETFSPDFGFGGHIACLDNTHMLWGTGFSHDLYFTTDGGTTWSIVTSCSGVPLFPSTTGWGAQDFLLRHIVAADRVANTYYAYNYNNAASDGVYSISANGATCTHVKTTQFDTSNASAFNATLKTVPGNSGHLFFTSGPQSPVAAGLPLYWNTGGGSGTWNTIANVQDVWYFGFGKTKAGSDGYPTFYCYCSVNLGSGYVPGLWQAVNIDATPTWRKLSDWAIGGSLDAVVAIEGDANTYGLIYGGYRGSGFWYGQFNFLLKRDLDPASNDNDPMWLEKAA